MTIWNTTSRGQPIKMTLSVADLNHSGATDLQDLFDFLALWFAQSPGGDFDASGTVGVQDIFSFLNRWFAERR